MCVRLSFHCASFHTNHNSLVIESNNVILATGSSMRDTENLDVCLGRCCLLDRVDNRIVLTLDVPGTQGLFFNLTGVVDEFCKIGCKWLVKVWSGKSLSETYLQ